MKNPLYDNTQNQNKSNREGYFINGKEQVVEMLRMMPTDERLRLIEQIRPRNPELAKELKAKSFSFHHIQSLNGPQIKLLMQNISPQILGIALKSMEESFQKKILTMATKEYATETYKILITPLKDMTAIGKAQNKIRDTLTQLGIWN